MYMRAAPPMIQKPNQLAVQFYKTEYRENSRETVRRETSMERRQEIDLQAEVNDR